MGLKVGDKVKVIGYDTDTAFFRDFQGKEVTVSRVVYDKVDKIEYIEIEEFKAVQNYHLCQSKHFKAV